MTSRLPHSAGSLRRFLPGKPTSSARRHPAPVTDRSLGPCRASSGATSGQISNQTVLRSVPLVDAGAPSSRYGCDYFFRRERLDSRAEVTLNWFLMNEVRVVRQWLGGAGIAEGPAPEDGLLKTAHLAGAAGRSVCLSVGEAAGHSKNSGPFSVGRSAEPVSRSSSCTSFLELQPRPGGRGRSSPLGTSTPT